MGCRYAEEDVRWIDEVIGMRVDRGRVEGVVGVRGGGRGIIMEGRCGEIDETNTNTHTVIELTS